MITFESFWDKLVEDEIWWDQMKVSYARKDWRRAGMQVYEYLLTEKNRWNAQDYSDYRRIWMKKIIWLPDIEVKQRPVVSTSEPDKTQGPILTGAEREARIKEWLDQVNKATNNFNVPRISKKEAAEEGDWLPKKPTNYNPPKTFLVLVSEAAKKFAGKKYKGLRYIDGFQRFSFGEVSILAENETDAKDIMKKAERLATRQLHKLQGDIL